MELKKGGQKSRPPSATQAGCRALTVLALPRRATLYTRNPSPQLSPLAPGRLQLCAQQLRRDLARTEGPGRQVPRSPSPPQTMVVRRGGKGEAPASSGGRTLPSCENKEMSPNSHGL